MKSGESKTKPFDRNEAMCVNRDFAHKDCAASHLRMGNTRELREDLFCFGRRRFIWFTVFSNLLEDQFEVFSCLLHTVSFTGEV